MSSRTVPRFALTALFVAALAAPVVAQDRPEAPMPREKIQISPIGPLTLDVTFPLNKTPNDNAQVFNFSVGVFGSQSRPAAPQPMTPPDAPGAFVIGPNGLERVMPLPEPPQFVVAPTPPPTGSFVIGVGRPVANSCAIGMCGTAPAPTFVPAGTTQSCARASGGCSACAQSCAANTLSGTWVRDAGVALIGVTFADGEMIVRINHREEDNIITLKLTGQYTVAKDGLVYGAITSADVDVKPDPADGMELAELSLMLQQLTDAPFSFRTKQTSAGLMVSHVKFAMTGDMDEEVLLVLGGLYKCSKDGTVPELKPLSAKSGCRQPEVIAGAVIGSAVGMTAGGLVGVACEKCDRVGIDFSNAPRPTMGQPVPPGGMLTPLPPSLIDTPLPPSATLPSSACPISCPPQADATKQMAADAFIQMVQNKERVRGGMTLPSPRYLEHYPQYFAPDPAFPLPRELACPEAADTLRAKGCGLDSCAPERYKNAATCATVTPLAAKPGVVGTWVRDVGSKRCVVKIAPDHFTATVSSAQEIDGKTSTAHLTFTVEYALTRDGHTAVGLVTGVDVKFDGDTPDDEADGAMQNIGELQKLLEDKPIALTFRLYGDALVIGNVRMPTTGGLLDGEPSGYIGGRYRAAGDKPLPVLKAAKPTAPKPLPVYGMPSPYAPPMPGVYTVPAPGFCPPMPLPGFCPPGVVCPPAFAPGVVLPSGPVYPVSAPTGDLLPPQHLGRPVPPTPTAVLPPIPFVEAIPPSTAIQAIQGVTIPEPVPPMTAPTAPVPTMPEPVAPTVSADEPKTGRLIELTVAWDQKLAALPDPTKNGALGAGIAGQLFIPGAQDPAFARANGTLTVDLVDETPRPAGQRGATPERWTFDKSALNKLATKNEINGRRYALFLPWSGDHSDVTRVALTVRYVPEGGGALLAAPTTITFERPAAIVPTMPKPVAPALGKLKLPKIFERQKYSSDPNVRVQQLLYESEDLPQIQNEWRRFWFPDTPNHLTPERIHGGIY